MFLASKAAWAGIVLIVLTTGTPGPPRRSLREPTSAKNYHQSGVRTISRRCRKLCATTESDQMVARTPAMRLRKVNLRQE